MKRHQGLVVSTVSGFVVVCLFLWSHTALAKGDFDKIVISGGELDQPLESQEPALLGFFALSEFPKTQIAKPPVAGAGYEIRRYADNIAAWDHLRYYPHASGTGGYLYYVGLLNGSSEYDAQWYTVSPAGDAALRRLLAVQPSPHSAANTPYPLVIVIGLITLTILGVELYVRLRQPEAVTV